MEIRFLLLQLILPIFSVPLDDPESMMGWRLLEKQIFIEIVKKGLPEPEPPRAG